MKKTRVPMITSLSGKCTITTQELQFYTGAGKETAIKIGIAAGARIKIGRRVLWNVEKVRRYLDEVSGITED